MNQEMHLFFYVAYELDVDATLKHVILGQMALQD